MKLTIDTSQLQRAAAQMADLTRQVQSATAKAINRTARDVRDAEKREMSDVFDRPTPYTLGSLFVQSATPTSPTATVGLKDDAGGSRSAVKWLRWQIYGGLRTMTSLEKRLVAAGAMPNDMRAVPGRFARLDAFGNLSTGQIRQILSQLRIELTQGATSALPRLSAEERGALRQSKVSGMSALSNRQRSFAKDATAKQRRITSAYKRAGGQFVAFPYGRGKLRPGIYQVRATAFGRTDPKPVMVFVTRASYEAGRFDFHYVADLVVRRRLQANVDAAMAQLGAAP